MKKRFKHVKAETEDWLVVFMCICLAGILVSTMTIGKIMNSYKHKQGDIRCEGCKQIHRYYITHGESK